MTHQISFTKVENELLPKFRTRIATAESTEDVKKFFAYSMQELFSRVFSGELEVEYGDVRLDPGGEPPFVISEEVRSEEAFTSTWNGSDLPQVIVRFARTALHRHNHLAGKPEKTEAKIRM